MPGMSDDWLSALLDRLPPVETVEERLLDGGVAVHFRGPGAPWADGGTLILPAGVLYTD